MKIRLKKPYSTYTPGWVGDCEESVARRLVADEIAESAEPQPVVESATIEPAVSRATANPKRHKRGSAVSNAEGGDGSDK